MRSRSFVSQSCTIPPGPLVSPSMGREKSQQREPRRESFEDTRPHLPMPAGFVASAFEGRLEGDHLVPVHNSESRHLDLTGQEFLRFRGIATAEEAGSLVDEYGLLWLPEATEQPTGSRPALWWWLGRVDHRLHEPVSAWVAQAGLLDIATGLIGLLRNPQAARSLVARVNRATEARSGRSWSMPVALSHQREVAAGAPWPVRSILDGGARAGLLCEMGEGHRLVRGRAPERYPMVLLSGFFTIPHLRGENDRVTFPPDLSFEPTRDGAARALSGLLNPWLRELHPQALAPMGEGLRPAVSVPLGLLSALWFQAANAALSDVAPRLCAWERCPGPPERPSVFLWRWGKSPSGTKHRDSIYCHPRCQHAAAVAKSRQTPGHRLAQERRKR
jgi:hypothetical protein